MKCIEIIELRTASETKETLESNLRELVRAVRRETEGKTIQLFRRDMMDTDYAIVLTHHAGEKETSITALGQHIASALKNFGMVNHTIWEEMDSQGGTWDGNDKT